MAAIAAAAVALPLLRNRQSRLLGAAAALAVAGAAAGLYPLWSNWDWHAPVAIEEPRVPKCSRWSPSSKSTCEDAAGRSRGLADAGPLVRRARAHRRCVVAYDHAHRLDASNVEAMLGLGEALSMRAGGDITPAAVELFEQAVALAPDDPKALLYWRLRRGHARRPGRGPQPLACSSRAAPAARDRRHARSTHRRARRGRSRAGGRAPRAAPARRRSGRSRVRRLSGRAPPRPSISASRRRCNLA